MVEESDPHRTFSKQGKLLSFQKRWPSKSKNNRHLNNVLLPSFLPFKLQS
jgi:hypothetical protein